MGKKRILLLIPTSSYRAETFVDAAREVGVDLVVGTDKRHTFQDFIGGTAIQLDFQDPEAAVKKILEYSKQYPLAAIIPTEDEVTVIASLAAKALKLPYNPPESVVVTRNKQRLRHMLYSNEFPSPRYDHIFLKDDPSEHIGFCGFPCILKPLALSASRGVIKANNESEFYAAFHRVGEILKESSAIERGVDEAQYILIEEYIPGAESVLEGILDNGKLKVLAIFDKPEPLVGPYFEETIYITPSQLPQKIQDEMAIQTEKAVKILGLTTGSVHVEFRLRETDGVYFPQETYMIELAARTIGGQCSKSLRFVSGTQVASLEGIVFMQAIGLPVKDYMREDSASGVMMIPIPARGILRSVEGVKEAKAIPGVTGVTITIPIGKPIIPLPEGSKYLGFIFGKHDSTQGVEMILSAAHSKLRFGIEPE